MSEVKPQNLYQRIRSVMQDVEYLKKDDSVGSGNYGYKAISEEKVTNAIRASLIKHGLVILPVSQEHLQVDHVRDNKIIPLTTVNVQYKIINIDDPEDQELLASSGTGVDPQDKGVGKAMTYAYKYMLLRTFAIPTGEDPDKIHNNDLDAQQAKAVKVSAGNSKTVVKPKAEPAPESSNLATVKQKTEMLLLLNNKHILPDEKAKMIDNINTLDTDRMEKALAKVKATIRERESAEPQTA